MSGFTPQVLVLLGSAVVCYIVQLALTVVLVATSSLSRVALRRLGSESESLLFVETMVDIPSAHRTATGLMRQLCLMGGTLSLALGLRLMGAARPGILAIALGTLVAIVLFDVVIAGSVASWDPRTALRRSAFLARWSHTVLFPLVHPVNRFLRYLGSMHQNSDEDREDEQEEEVEAFIEVGERDGILEASESEMMRSIVDLDETRVREIMTPRTDIVAVRSDATVSEARGAFLEAGHSRLPAYRESVDDIVGVLHVRDLLQAWADDQSDQPIAPLLREAMFVPESSSVADLLSEMQVNAHMALVVDEYGGVAGLVTLEDLLEEIVGDIRDEHDTEEEALVIREASGAYAIKATAHVEELEELFGVELENRDFDTVGGLVVSRFGRVPTVGEILEVHGLRIEVLDADLRRIHMVRIQPAEPPGEAQAGG